MHNQAVQLHHAEARGQDVERATKRRLGPQACGQRHELWIQFPMAALQCDPRLAHFELLVMCDRGAPLGGQLREIRAGIPHHGIFDELDVAAQGAQAKQIDFDVLAAARRHAIQESTRRRNARPGLLT